MIVWLSFNEALHVCDQIQSELLLGQFKTSTASHSIRCLVFAVCSMHGSIVQGHRWSGSRWLSRCGTAWVSRTSSKFRQAVMCALDLDQRQFVITGKVPQHHDGSFSVGISSLNTGRMERLKGAFFDALRVRPIGPTWGGHLVLSFRGYQRFDQRLQLSYPPLKSLLHRIVELRLYLSWLSRGNTASQTQWTVGIYGPLFRNYWLDYH